MGDIVDIDEEHMNEQDGLEEGEEEFEDDEEGEEEEEELSDDEDYQRAMEEAHAELTGEEVEGEDDEEEGEEEEESEDPFEFSADNDPNSKELPQSWAQDDKKIWDKIPDDAKAKVKLRENQLLGLVTKKADEYHNATEEYRRASAPLQNALRELEPYAKEWRMGKNPVTLEQGILRAVEVYETIKNTSNLQLAKEFLAASGHGPEALRSTPQEGTQREISQLRDTVNQLQTSLSERDKASSDAQSNQTAQEIRTHLNHAYQRFASTLNPHREEKYPDAKKPYMAQAVGSLVIQLAERFPGQPTEWYFRKAYEQAGGQIQNGKSTRFSNNNERVRDASTNAYSKAGRDPRPELFENDDEALEAAARELGWIE